MAIIYQSHEWILRSPWKEGEVQKEVEEKKAKWERKPIVATYNWLPHSQVQVGVWSSFPQLCDLTREFQCCCYGHVNVNVIEWLLSLQESAYQKEVESATADMAQQLSSTTSNEEAERILEEHDNRVRILEMKLEQDREMQVEGLKGRLAERRIRRMKALQKTHQEQVGNWK